MAYDATDFVVTEAPAPVVRDPKMITDPRERMIYLRNHIAELPRERFDMAIYATLSSNPQGDCALANDVRHDCGSKACLCGWTVVLFDLGTETDDDLAAGEALGLSETDATRLFIPSHKSRGEIANVEAVAVLDHYLETGKIDWSVA